jgi:hypothetical protein
MNDEDAKPTNSTAERGTGWLAQDAVFLSSCGNARFNPASLNLPKNGVLTKFGSPAHATIMACEIIRHSASLVDAGLANNVLASLRFVS